MDGVTRGLGGTSTRMVLALSLPSQLSPRTIWALSPNKSSGSRCTVVRRSAPLGSRFRVLLDPLCVWTKCTLTLHTRN